MTCPSSTLLPSFRTNISWHQSQIQAIESCLMFCLNFHGSILYLQNSRWKQVCFIFTRCPQGRLSISCNFYVGVPSHGQGWQFQEVNRWSRLQFLWQNSVYFNDLTSKQQSNMSNASLTWWHLWNLDVKGSLRRSHRKIRRLRGRALLWKKFSLCVPGFRSHLSWL